MTHTAAQPTAGDSSEQGFGQQRFYGSLGARTSAALCLGSLAGVESNQCVLTLNYRGGSVEEAMAPRKCQGVAFCSNCTRDLMIKVVFC